jgi:hypothetical protein
VLVDCPKIKDMWMFILNLCHCIDPSVVGLSEKNLLIFGLLFTTTDERFVRLPHVRWKILGLERTSFVAVQEE